MIKFAINRPISVGCIFAGIFLVGLVSLRNLPLELYPSIEYPKLSIVTYGRDKAPLEIERYATSKIEELLSSVRGIRNIKSISEMGKSTVELELSRDVDPELVRLEIIEKLSMLKLGEDYSPPEVIPYVPREFERGTFFILYLSGEQDIGSLRKLAEEKIKPKLLGITGVGGVTIHGGTDRIIKIAIDYNKAKLFNIKTATIIRSLSQSNLSWSPKSSTPMTIVSRVHDIAQIRNLPITKTVRLKDIADITQVYKEPTYLSRIDGKSRVSIMLDKEIGANSLSVAKRIRAKLNEIKLPQGVKIMIAKDASKEVRSNLKQVSILGIISILIIFFVLFLFLRRFVISFVILTSIFFSSLTALILLYLSHISLNLITIAGLALAFGMLVDNSIVVLENIYRRQEEGDKQAELGGATEVFLPIFASTITTICVLVPFLYFGVELRSFYLPFALALSFALLASIFTSFTLIPTISGRILRVKGAMRTYQVYERFLNYVFRNKLWILAVVALVFGTSIFVFKNYIYKGKIFKWGEETYLLVYIRMPPGTRLKYTDEVAKFFEDKLKNFPGIDHYYTTVTPENGWLKIDVQSDVKNTALPYILKERLQTLATLFAGCDVHVYGFGPSFYGGGVYMERIQLEGFSYNELERIAEDIGDRLRLNPRVKNVDTDFSWYKRGGGEYVLKLNQERMAELGISVDDLISMIREKQILRMEIKNKEMEVVVEDRGRHLSYDDFISIGDLSLKEYPGRIVRKNQSYERAIGYEFRGPWKMGKAYRDALLSSLSLPPGYSVMKEEYWMEQRGKKQIILALIFAGVLVYMILASLYESYLKPFIIMLTVPLSFVGVVFAFFLTGTEFDSSAYIGVILLVGIVVNNAIILVDHISQLEKQGEKDAIIRGTLNRLRPILMTSTTTILGLAPFLFIKPEVEIFAKFALAAIGGLAISTIFTLTIIPLLYKLFTLIKSKIC